MDKKSDSNIIIKQVLEVSLAVIIVLCGSILCINQGENTRVEIASVEIQNQYVESIVENDEDDYIHYEQIVYLDKKEITEEKVEIKSEKNVADEIVELEEETTEKDVNAESIESNDVPPVEYKEVIEVKATAYCLCKKCCGKSETHPEYGVTASGLKIVPGTNMKVIAVDPKVIPLGSKVYVEGLNGVSDYGYAVAADTGGAIKNLKIDLYMDSHETTKQWGIKNVKVYVLE